jgi:hypothetical protein
MIICTLFDERTVWSFTIEAGPHQYSSPIPAALMNTGVTSDERMDLSFAIEAGPDQFSGSLPTGLMTIINCLERETTQKWTDRSTYLHPQ